MKTTKLLFLAFIAFLTSCVPTETDEIKQIIDSQIDNKFKKNFGKKIKRDFLGLVIDENKNPIEGVQIKLETETATTDENGVFLIKNAPVYERFAYVKAQKQGYINASRSVTPTIGTNNITIMMLKENPIAEVASGKETKVETKGGAIVKLPGNYIKEDGTAYNGSVSVVSHFLSPSDENLDAKMPGMLYAQNNNGEERMLQTYGMMAVELIGSSGEKLNIAPGSFAELSIPIDPSLLANAPATIPLWYFDEDKGYWIEEGEATKIGSNYVGKTEHFSFWNCDIPAQAITLCVDVVDANSNPIANATVSITSTTYGTRNGTTNGSGQVCGLVPQNESLVLNIYNPICGNSSLYTSNIGPFNSNSTITVTINQPSISTETVTGTLVDCNNNPVTNGYAILTYNNQPFNTSVTNGTFQMNLFACNTSNTFTIEGIDFTNIQTSGQSNFNFTSPTTNVGTLTACNNVSEYIQYTLDGVQQTILSPIDATYSTSTDELYIKADLDLCYLGAKLTPAPSLGTYNNSCNGSIGFNIKECLQMDNCNSPGMTYNLTALGTTVGSYIDINFNGTYIDTSGNNHTINGVYHVLIDAIQ